jgi:glycosyltransferase involved in cell wall biosynthesis
MAETQKIAFVANTSWSIYKFRLYLIEKLIERGFTIQVLTPRDAYTARFEGMTGLTFVELRHFKSKSISPIQDTLLYKELLRHYRSLQPDLIFHYTVKANIFGAMAAANAGISAICVVTGLGYTFTGKGWLQTVVKVLYKKALRKTAEVWFLNEDDRQVFLKDQLIDPARAFVLPGEGVDPEVFFAAPFDPGRHSSPDGPRQIQTPSPDDPSQNLSPRHPAPSTPLAAMGMSQATPAPPKITFLLIARIIRHKGIHEFVEAAKKLKQQGLAVQCQLLGFFDDNNPVAISRQEIAEWERRNILSYLGHTDDVAKVIEKADCIVLPSYREGMPLSLLEGASMCKTLIAADTPGCRTLIREGINGYLCREKDGADLARAMTAYYHLPPSAKAQMGIEGRKIVLQSFTREIVTGIYLEKINALHAHPAVHRV